MAVADGTDSVLDLRSVGESGADGAAGGEEFGNYREHAEAFEVAFFAPSAEDGDRAVAGTGVMSATPLLDRERLVRKGRRPLWIGVAIGIPLGLGVGVAVDNSII